MDNERYSPLENFARSIRHYNNPNFYYSFDELTSKMRESGVVSSIPVFSKISAYRKLRKGFKVKTAGGLVKITFEKKSIDDWGAKLEKIED